MTAYEVKTRALYRFTDPDTICIVDTFNRYSVRINDIFIYYHQIGLSNQLKFAMLSGHFHVLILWSKHHIFRFQTNH